jgi:hypothetical protein
VNLGVKRPDLLTHAHVCRAHYLAILLGTWERSFSPASPDLFVPMYTGWKGMDYREFVFYKAGSFVLLLVQNAQRYKTKSLELMLYSLHM